MNKNGMTGSGSVASTLDDKLDSLRDSMKGVVDQGAQRVDQLKSKLIDVKDEAFSRGGDLVTHVTSLIKEHPLKAIAIAFGAGYIGMRIFRR